MKYDDETLMAYADGELEAGVRQEIEASMVLDPELARRVAAHRRLRARVADQYQAELEAPVPDALMALLRPAPSDDAASDDAAPQAERRVLPFTPPAANGRRAMWANLAAIAASLLIGVLIGGQWPGRDGGDVLLRATPEGLFAAGQLEAALTGDVSGAAGRDGIEMMFTFPTADGGYCRSFTASGTAGIACRDATGWQVRSTGALPLPAGLLEEIDRLSAGDPLDPGREAELIARGWRRAD